MRRSAFVTIVPIMLAACGASTSDPIDRPADDGLVTVISAHDVTTTASRIEVAIEAIDAVTLVARFDHASAAARRGLSLPPTIVLVIANPSLGTPLMQEHRSVAIDLPQKILVRADDGGITRVTYNDPRYVARRHGIDPTDDAIVRMSRGLAALVAGAISPSSSGS